MRTLLLSVIVLIARSVFGQIYETTTDLNYQTQAAAYSPVHEKIFAACSNKDSILLIAITKNNSHEIITSIPKQHNDESFEKIVITNDNNVVLITSILETTGFHTYRVKAGIYEYNTDIGSMELNQILTLADSVHLVRNTNFKVLNAIYHNSHIYITHKGHQHRGIIGFEAFFTVAVLNQSLDVVSNRYIVNDSLFYSNTIGKTLNSLHAENGVLYNYTQRNVTMIKTIIGDTGQISFSDSVPITYYVNNENLTHIDHSRFVYFRQMTVPVFPRDVFSELHKHNFDITRPVVLIERNMDSGWYYFSTDHEIASTQNTLLVSEIYNNMIGYNDFGLMVYLFDTACNLLSTQKLIHFNMYNNVIVPLSNDSFVVVGNFDDSISSFFASRFICRNRFPTNVEKTYKANQALRFYPNPANNYVRIEGYNGNWLEAINSLGQTFLLNKNEAGNYNTEELSSGIYFLRSEMGMLPGKLLINHY
jgi:hypothetical protein